MSRTDKTRPYWVKVQDHGVEHHDHSRLGEEVWYSRNMVDEDGNPVFEELPYFHSVGDLLASKDERLADWSWVTDRGLTIPKRGEDGKELRIWRWNREYQVTKTRIENKARNDAMYLRAHGHPDTALVEAGTYKRPKQERYLAYTVPDRCTIDDKPNMVSRWSNANPCYMEADWDGAFRTMFRYRCSCCSPQGYNAAKRAIARDTLKEVAKQYNSGEDDWEDAFDARENITPRRKAGQSWW